MSDGDRTVDSPACGSMAERAPIRSRPTVVALAGVALAGFVVIGALVAAGWGPLLAADSAGVLAAHRLVLADPVVLAVARVVTDLGGPVAVDVVTAVVAVGLLAARRWRAALYLIVVRLVELGIETAVKHLLGRPRPALPDAVAVAGGFSFPSGHAAGSAAVYGAVAVLVVTVVARSRRVSAGGQRRVATTRLAGVSVGLVVLAVAVAASRVLLGVHYPSDVVGGLLLGLACVLAALPLTRLSGGVRCSRGPAC